jgi:hypothetical protein
MIPHLYFFQLPTINNINIAAVRTSEVDTIPMSKKNPRNICKYCQIAMQYNTILYYTIQCITAQYYTILSYRPTVQLQ